MNISTIRTRAALEVLVLIFPIAAILLGAQQTARMTRAEYGLRTKAHGNDPKSVERLVSQFAYLLPPYGSVGYIDPDHSWSSANATRQFFQTQYALVPRVLVENSLPDYVIYFSQQELPFTDAAIPADLRVLHKVRLDLVVLTRAK